MKNIPYRIANPAMWAIKNHKYTLINSMVALAGKKTVFANVGVDEQQKKWQSAMQTLHTLKRNEQTKIKNPSKPN